MLQQIEALQMHDNNAIYNKALKILTKYFGVDEEDTTIAPATDGQTFAFGTGTATWRLVLRPLVPLQL
jgi:importin subunit alpha-6/7